MKPPQTLDHVMLWYARGFTIYFLVRSSEWPPPSVPCLSAHLNLVTVPLFLWTVSCFCLRISIARLYLMLSGTAAIFVIGRIGLQEIIINGPPYFMNSLPWVWLLASFAVLSWVGFRASGNSGLATAQKGRKRNAKPAQNSSSSPTLFRRPISLRLLPSFH